jgi:hypothetical protein
MVTPVLLCRAIAALAQSALLVCLALSVSAQRASAQTLRRWELTTGLTVIRFADFNPYNELQRQIQTLHPAIPTWIDPGVELRVGFCQNSEWVWEAAAALFPRFAEDKGIEFRGGAKGVLEGGGRYRHRIHRGLAVGGLAHLGVIDFERAPRIFGVAQAANTTLTAVGEIERRSVQTFLAVVFEVQLSNRTKVSFDLGDSIVLYRPQPADVNPRFSRQNLRLDVGFGIGFGRRMD